MIGNPRICWHEPWKKYDICNLEVGMDDLSWLKGYIPNLDSISTEKPQLIELFTAIAERIPKFHENKKVVWAQLSLSLPSKNPYKETDKYRIEYNYDAKKIIMIDENSTIIDSIL